MKKINRFGTFSSKWDEPQKKFYQDNMIHMAVADMDFKISESISNAIINKTNHGVLGYTYFADSTKEIIAQWLKNKHDVSVDPNWIVFIPRVSIAASIFVENFSEVGDKIIINTPTYPPLRNAITSNNRLASDNSLVRVDKSWKFDFDALEALIDDTTRAIILVNPDNPSGRAWRKNELLLISKLVEKYDLLIFSDEVHSDIIAPNSIHNTMLNISEQTDQRLIYAGSLSKSFNIPGLLMSYLIIPNSNIRTIFEEECHRIGMNNPPVFANEVFKAAYNSSDLWLTSVLSQINRNEIKLTNAIKESMPNLILLKREATYLSIIDFSNFNITDQDIIYWFEFYCNITIYSGIHFGIAGTKLVRLNLATDETTFDEAVHRMIYNYKKLKEF